MGQTCCCMEISESKVGIRERWGKYDGVLEPGVHFVNWCTGKKIKRIINLRLQQVDVKCQTRTQDEVFLIVATSVQYRIASDMANQAYYKLVDPRVQIRSFVLDIITSTVPKMNLKDVYDKQEEISKAAESYLQTEMSFYGLDIVKTLIIEIFPDEVNQSFNERKPGNIKRNVDHVNVDMLNKLANGFDALLEYLKAKDQMQRRLLDIEERNAQLLERHCVLEKEQLQVAKQSLTILTEVKKQKMETLAGALNTLASSISGLKTPIVQL